jgi:pimeloyl-ACP methyl ester carboxylesterase
VTLVFIHGSGGDADVWRRQADHFPTSIALTLPGHPDGDPCTTIESAGDWVWAELVRRGVERPIVAGHSLGGGIALQLGLDHAGELGGLILIGTGARLRVHPATLAAVEQLAADGGDAGAFFADAFALIDDEFATDLRAAMTDKGALPFLADLRACNDFDVVERLGEITTPALAIVGTDDVMTPPKYSQFLVDGMPDARVEVIDGGTHFVFAEQPDRVNAAIRGFLDGLPSS